MNTLNGDREQAIAAFEGMVKGWLNDVLDERERRGGTIHGWQSQNKSTLGRKHNSVVRARIERGESGASIVGRRHLLSPEALVEELQRQGQPSKLVSSNAVAELRSALDQLSED